MRFTFSALFVCLAVIGPFSQLQAAPIVDASGDPQAAANFCGVPEVSRDEQLAVHRQVDAWISAHGGLTALGGNIKIAWHVIYDGTTGNVPQSTIDAQIAVLNAAYAGVPGGVNTGYTFSLASVDRTNNRKWFNLDMGTREEQQAKRALALDVTHRLNIYTCKPPSNGNWGTFPWAFPEGNYMTGVVIHYGCLPGGQFGYYNIGNIGVHEVGHYLGLLHTFQGGCVAPGDEVDDTPDEGIADHTICPDGRDSCPSPGLDPIHNYMDYTVDSCRTELTAGQDGRMDSMVLTYRPHLLNAPFTQNGTAIELTFDEHRKDIARAGGIQFAGAAPNPFQGTTEIRFALPASTIVQLHIYNAGGRLVTTLANGPMDAGAHTVTFSGQHLSSGIYFAVLRAGGRLITRSVVLSR
jgi:hypothetical protein